jgi:hypothetical protein
MNPARLRSEAGTLHPRFLEALAVWGLLAAVIGALLLPQRIWPMILLVSFGLICVALSGAVFIAIQYVTGASWCVAFRRIPEAMTAALPAGACGLAAVLYFKPEMYPWMHELHEVTPALSFKHFWLSQSFFTIRALIYLVLWHVLIRRIVNNSRRQDESPDPAFTRSNVRWSAAFLVVFGITFSLASFDWVMSLEPHWYSTIFAVYNFAGLFLSGLAVMALLAARYQQTSALGEVISAKHLLDLGRLMGAFSTFWAYIWFSQYMLIWYANIPEETSYYILRLKTHWAPLFVINAIMNWALPFLLLLLRATKQNPHSLAGVSVILLLGRVLDLYLMIKTPFAGEAPVFGLWEISLLAGAVAVFLLLFRRALGQANLVPIGDPRLQESLHYH